VTDSAATGNVAGRLNCPGPVPPARREFPEARQWLRPGLEVISLYHGLLQDQSLMIANGQDSASIFAGPGTDAGSLPVSCRAAACRPSRVTGQARAAAAMRPARAAQAGPPLQNGGPPAPAGRPVPGPARGR
jgi:hypothetical protein